MKDKLIHIVFPLLLLAFGLGALFYPTASDLWNQNRQNKLISEYKASVENLSEDAYSELKEAAYNYNATLNPSLHDAFSGTQLSDDETYRSLLDPSGTGIMGYIEIPSISVRLGIYHGTNADSLEHGAGHLAGSSLPVGGAGTHSIISAHRGLPSALLFTDLDQLEIGDMFYIYVLNETLAYKVDQILVVEPDDVSAVSIVEGEDYVTLVTCTPYGVNTHRLLVRGSRIQLDDDTELETVSTTDQIANSFGWKGKLVIAIVALTVVLLVFGKIRKKGGKAAS